LKEVREVKYSGSKLKHSSPEVRNLADGKELQIPEKNRFNSKLHPVGVMNCSITAWIELQFPKK